MQQPHFDVLVFGAGLSGVAAGYHLQTHLPGKSYAILEGRARLGGTWDLFRYPGIRSDSDMYTLGYGFRPWMSDKAIADGASILEYIRGTAEAHGIDRKIHYGRKIERAEWSSRDARWTVHARDAETGELRQYTCNFILSCTGYYDYEQGYTPELAGRESFKGEIIHPQAWPEDLDYSGKRVVVIGSGATAVTLVPALAKKAAHVTMLQRSPTYVVSLPEEDAFAKRMRAILPPGPAHFTTRWKNVLLNIARYNYCRARPEQAKRFILRGIKKQIGDKVDVRKHFTPSYKPWDQRVCLVPDGDLFDALRDGRASVVTEHIDRFVENGIRLRSGETLEADLIVTATGLNLKFFGGIALVIDGERVDPGKLMLYRGSMLSDVPNLVMAVGYTNASWTLKCTLSLEYACRIMKHMDEQALPICVAPRDPEIREDSLLNLSSGYVQRARGTFPIQGHVEPWKLRQNYVRDMLMLRRSKLDDGALRFTKPSA